MKRSIGVHVGLWFLSAAVAVAVAACDDSGDPPKVDGPVRGGPSITDGGIDLGGGGAETGGGGDAPADVSTAAAKPARPTSSTRTSIPKRR